MGILKAMEEKEDISEHEDNLGNTEDLTYDERKALEMFQASRSKALASEDSEEEEEEGTINKEEEDLEDGEERRAISYEMAKNKGMKAKRSKEQRNPRVKHKKKYLKAKVRRKGQVREVRTETKRYTGEHSGINARVKKGIKLG